MGERLVDAQRNSKLLGGVNGFQSLTAPSAAEAVNTSTISRDAVVVLVTSAGAGNRVYLPSPTEVVDGKTYQVVVTANGCELSSKGDGTTATTISGTAVTNANGTYLKEVPLAANSLVHVVKSGANAWVVTKNAAGDTADA